MGCARSYKCSDVTKTVWVRPEVALIGRLLLERFVIEAYEASIDLSELAGRTPL